MSGKRGKTTSIRCRSPAQLPESQTDIPSVVEKGRDGGGGGGGGRSRNEEGKRPSHGQAVNKIIHTQSQCHYFCLEASNFQ